MAASALALPLVVSPATADNYFLPKLAAARAVVIGLLLITGVAAVMGRLRLRRTPLDIPLAFFVVSALVSMIFAVNTNLAIFGSYTRYEGFLTILLYALLFWLAVQALDGVSNAVVVVRALLGAAFLVSLVGILQVAFGSLVGPGPAETGFAFGGVLRGYATFGNPNALGAFLAMLLPIAVWEMLAARSASGRLLSANVIAVLTLGLLLTFSRSAWAGAAIGVTAVLLATTRLRWAALAASTRVRWTVLVVSALVALLLVGVQLAPPSGSPTIVNAAVSRLRSIEAPLATSSGQFRLQVWRDTLALIASRPFFGYGPDTFGLVYPRFQTAHGAASVIIDRAHTAPLDVAATQGLVGLFAYAALLLAMVRAFLKRRHDLQSVALFGGFLSYETYTLLNFSYLPAALPFWLFMAAAVTVWSPPTWVPIRGRAPALAGIIVVATALLLVIPAVSAPFQADLTYKTALDAAAKGRRDEARNLVESARSLAPYQSTYAVAAGSLALDLSPDGRPAPDADWSAARAAFLAASRLGTFNSAAYRNLAIADAALGRRQEALAAAQMAVQLNRFDPANQAELASLRSR